MTNLALMFPGYGSQTTGMLRKYMASTAVQRVVGQAEDILGQAVRPLLEEKRNDKDMGMNVMVPLIYISSVALLDYVKEQGPVFPSCLIGHSLGQYAALTAAGSLRFEDGVGLVNELGRILHEASAAMPASMAVLHGLSVRQVESICEQVSGRTSSPLFIACYNSPRQAVVSAGYPHALPDVLQEAKAQGGYGIIMRHAGPMHCELMKPFEEEFRSILQNYRFEPPKIPIVSCMHKRFLEHDQIRDELADLLCLPVYWDDTVQLLRRQGVEHFLEVGPGNLLANLIENTYVDIRVSSLDRKKDEPSIAMLLQGQRSNVAAFYSACIRSAVSSRNNNDDESEYWEGVVQPYRKLQALWHEAVQGAIHTDERIEEGIELTRTIWATKHIPEAEREQRLEEILSSLRSGKEHILTGKGS